MKKVLFSKNFRKILKVKFTILFFRCVKVSFRRIISSLQNVNLWISTGVILLCKFLTRKHCNHLKLVIHYSRSRIFSAERLKIVHQIHPFSGYRFKRLKHYIECNNFHSSVLYVGKKYFMNLITEAFSIIKRVFMAGHFVALHLTHNIRFFIWDAD